MTMIFISYSRKDNKPITLGENGWVTDFRGALVAEMMHVNCALEGGGGEQAAADGKSPHVVECRHDERGWQNG